MAIENVRTGNILEAQKEQYVQPAPKKIWCKAEYHGLDDDRHVFSIGDNVYFRYAQPEEDFTKGCPVIYGSYEDGKQLYVTKPDAE